MSMPSLRASDIATNELSSQGSAIAIDTPKGVTFSVLLAAAFRMEWPKHTAKHVAACAGVSTRTAEAWVAGTKEPRASSLIAMTRKSDALRAEVYRLMNKENP